MSAGYLSLSQNMEEFKHQILVHWKEEMEHHVDEADLSFDVSIEKYWDLACDEYINLNFTLFVCMFVRGIETLEITDRNVFPLLKFLLKLATFSQGKLSKWYTNKGLLKKSVTQSPIRSDFPENLRAFAFKLVKYVKEASIELGDEDGEKHLMYTIAASIFTKKMSPTLLSWEARKVYNCV